MNENIKSIEIVEEPKIPAPTVETKDIDKRLCITRDVPQEEYISISEIKKRIANRVSQRTRLDEEDKKDDALIDSIVKETGFKI